MNLKRLLTCFNPKELEQLKTLINAEPEVAAKHPEVSLKDFLTKAQITDRLKTILTKNFLPQNILVSEIQKKEFLKLRTAGPKSWQEFIEARGY